MAYDFSGLFPTPARLPVAAPFPQGPHPFAPVPMQLPALPTAAPLNPAALLHAAAAIPQPAPPLPPEFFDALLAAFTTPRPAAPTVVPPLPPLPGASKNRQQKG